MENKEPANSKSTIVIISVIVAFMILIMGAAVLFTKTPQSVRQTKSAAVSGKPTPMVTPTPAPRTTSGQSFQSTTQDIDAKLKELDSGAKELDSSDTPIDVMSE